MTDQPDLRTLRSLAMGCAALAVPSVDLLALLDRLDQAEAKVAELQGILIDNTHELRVTLLGSSSAMGCSPREAWERNLGEVADLVAELARWKLAWREGKDELAAALERARTLEAERDGWKAKAEKAWEEGDRVFPERWGRIKAEARAVALEAIVETQTKRCDEALLALNKAMNRATTAEADADRLDTAGHHHHACDLSRIPCNCGWDKAREQHRAAVAARTKEAGE